MASAGEDRDEAGGAGAGDFDEFRVTDIHLIPRDEAVRTGGGPADFTRPGDEPVLDRHMSVAADRHHRVHDSPAIQDAIITMIQLAVQQSRRLPPVLPDDPNVVGYGTTPDAPNYGARTFAIIKDGLSYHLEFLKLGPLLTQAEMEGRVWEVLPEDSRLVRTWFFTFGRFFYRGYYERPDYARMMEAERQLAMARWDIVRLRRQIGQRVDRAEEDIDPALLEPEISFGDY